MLKSFRILTILLATFSLSACLFTRPSELERAEEFSRQKDYVAAIDSYRKHMEDRLEIENRPEWENPYFYLILIGDIQLGTDKPEEALKSFLEADERKVDSYLVSDRIRSVARYYEGKGNLDRAIEILLPYREKDGMLFDVMLDRIYKAKSAQEEKSESQGAK